MGSKEEKKQIKDQYKNECDFFMSLKDSRLKDEERRDRMQT